MAAFVVAIRIRLAIFGVSVFVFGVILFLVSILYSLVWFIGFVIVS